MTSGAMLRKKITALVASHSSACSSRSLRLRISWMVAVRGWILGIRGLHWGLGELRCLFNGGEENGNRNLQRIVNRAPVVNRRRASHPLAHFDGDFLGCEPCRMEDDA